VVHRVQPRFLPAGDTALIVEVGDEIDRELSARVLRLSAVVRGARIPGVVETVPTYRSLMVRYDPLVTTGARLASAIGEALDRVSGTAAQTRLWRIPACYEATHALDLDHVARRTGLTTEEVVRLHAGTCFHVYMVGFVPGFPYLGDLPRALNLPRREDPRVKVPAGSIAIALGMTAIYPLESPGGWHLIGATPVKLFDVCASRPSLLSPGDAVRFEPISAFEFDQIRAAVEAETYRPVSEGAPE
jgi:inhibitor of KinA